MERNGLSTGEVLVVVIGGAAIVVGGVVWAGAALAALLTGAAFAGTLSDSFTALPSFPEHFADPAAAWPGPAGEALPGPFLYWLCTIVVAAAAVAVLVVAFRLWNRSRVGTRDRRPLGVDARPGFATTRDLRPLMVDGPVRGRFILGRAKGKLLATEDRSSAPKSDRAGDRGAVALVGPSRSGKTTAVVSGVLEWDGPAILSSVKDDLLRVTAGWRAERGRIAVFDPTGTTGRDGTAVWSPLTRANTTTGAQRAARALCDAAPKGNNVQGGLDFWMAQAEMLLAGLLFVARHTNADMGLVAEWVLVQDRPGEWGEGNVSERLITLENARDEQMRLDAADARRSLKAIWEDEERTRSSVYATARTVIWPWADPSVAKAAQGKSIDLEWLLEGRNTIYLCAPIEDQSRLSPAFGGFLNDVIKQAYLKVAETGKPIDPPLLIVIDEAGNTPLRNLPEYASTLAGLGIVLVTVWQSLAQIESAYGRSAGTIVTNHLSKVFYAGLSDPESQRYVSTILGEEEVETRSRSNDLHGGGRGSLQLSTVRAPLAPAHALRQMVPGDALLIHGTLPPAHIRTRPYYREPGLSERSQLPVPDEAVTNKPKNQQEETDDRPVPAPSRSRRWTAATTRLRRLAHRPVGGRRT